MNYHVDLIGASEIAKLAGVKRMTVQKWKERHQDFPQPAERLTMGMLYRRIEVVAWLLKTGRLHKDTV